ncbi:MAG: ATP-binding cassette domain-containing protein, partial [Alphaproteobacteria bacterium]|nr:ATP-binding cassette domain-containing protein [Alphaproteobacteria bacterium]
YSAMGVGIEELGLFLLILLRLMPILREAIVLRSSMALTRYSLVALQQRLETLEQSPEADFGLRRFGGLHEGIRFDRVAFNYSTSGTPALNDVTVFLPARRLTALVGPSGGGKSTLIDLIPRLRDPDGGVVSFDGVPATELILKSLRAGIAYAPQTPQLFDTTIAEHIRYGRPEANLAEIEKAAQLAGAHDFIIKQSAGYETRIGEGGGMLSGGQRQRVDLARALIKHASVLILDEPTSQLDAESEEIFKTSIGRIRDVGHHTIIMVAHRLSTAAIADHIVVMMNGRVIDSGTHNELLARGGWYANAFELQQGGDRAAPADQALTVGQAMAT